MADGFLIFMVVITTFLVLFHFYLRRQRERLFLQQLESENPEIMTMRKYIEGYKDEGGEISHV